jgi:hypothetical protein
LPNSWVTHELVVQGWVALLEGVHVCKEGLSRVNAWSIPEVVPCIVANDLLSHGQSRALNSRVGTRCRTTTRRW